jgi:glycosyltransferase involved in cell wall biosynthesis
MTDGITHAMSTPCLSVIIPSYNCGQWLERAVRSTQQGSPGPIEVMIIDDGSTDDTATLGPALAAQIEGVHYFHKQNGGLSDARNYGIERATGAYIALLDADDELFPFDLGEALAAGVDIIKVGMEKCTDDFRLLARRQEVCPSMSGRDYLRQAFLHNTFYTESWQYVYRRDFLEKNRLRFKFGLLHEDNLFTIQALMAARSVIAVPDVVYRYISREGSITTSASRAKLLRRIDALSEITRDLTSLAGKERDFDLRWRIERIIGYAEDLAVQCGGFWPIAKVLAIQLRYMATYRGFDAPGIRYTQRRGLRERLRVMAAQVKKQLVRRATLDVG